jgi:4-hydroxybenzoate polyprenyltransferase
MLDVERIGRQVLPSGVASILSLWLYFSILFGLFFRTTPPLDEQATLLGIVTGLVAGVLVWLVLGGRYLLQNPHQAPAPA